jgi:hypothetical protein
VLNVRALLPSAGGPLHLVLLRITSMLVRLPKQQPWLGVSLQMVEAIYWCLELGVPFISVYAFSIDNFGRSLEEVTGLMALAERKYHELASVRAVLTQCNFSPFILIQFH